MSMLTIFIDRCGRQLVFRKTAVGGRVSIVSDGRFMNFTLTAETRGRVRRTINRAMRKAP